MNEMGSDRALPMNTGDPAPRFGFRRFILLSCAIALGVYHIFASAVMYPVPGGDAHVFMPAAINLKAGRGLTNSLWEVAPDPTGQHRYVAHPPLFQMIVSACMLRAETRSAFIVLGIFNALTLALYAAFLSSAKCARRMLASTAGFVVLLTSIFALAFLIFNDAGGRPEVLSTLILTLAIGVVTWLPRKCWPICLGIAIGLTGAIHPVHGIFIGCLTTIVFLLTTPLPQVAAKLMIAAAVALALFWSLLSLSPYPVGETLHAVSDHAALANGDYPLSALVDFYVKLAPWSGLLPAWAVPASHLVWYSDLAKRGGSGNPGGAAGRAAPDRFRLLVFFDSKTDFELLSHDARAGTHCGRRLSFRRSQQVGRRGRHRRVRFG